MVINHNAMAAGAARSLGVTYGKLNTSVQRLSSGLRINSAADDAAGLAIREMMRADIATTQQGIRNAADAISMIQTADGALGVIDEKLTRMKELAEQAANGTYTTAQRDIINSEYQAMAKEIDRIAAATNFNGIKLLDGSVSNQHGGQGLKIHFGTSNNAAEDYYFVNIGDARATSSTGLRVGGDAKNDIWGQGAAASGPLSGPGCCTAGFASLNGNAGFASGQSFSYGYNWDWREDEDEWLLSGVHLAGRYTVQSGESLQDLVNKVNAGTQSRVAINIDGAALADSLDDGIGALAICIGDEAYVFGNSAVAAGGEVTTAARQAFLADASYNFGKSYITVGGRSFFFDSTNNALKNVLAGLSSPKTAKDMTYTLDDFEVSSDNGAIASSELMDKITDLIQAEIDGLPANRFNLGVDYGGPSWSNLDTAVKDKINAAMAARSGTNFNGQAWIDGSPAFNINTGVYVDANGNWTQDSDIAAAFGMTEVIARIEDAPADPGYYKVSCPTMPGWPGFITRDDLSDAGMSVGSAAEAVVTARHAASGLGGSERELRNLGNYGGTYIDPAKLTHNVTTKTIPASTAMTAGVVAADKRVTLVSSAGPDAFTGEALASAINHNADSDFWAMTQGDVVFVFAKEGGDNNHLQACEVFGRDEGSREAAEAVNFARVVTFDDITWNNSGAAFNLGGEKWATMTPVQTRSDRGFENWNLTLSGRDVGRERDIWIANLGEIEMPGIDESIINGLDRDSFLEIQNADDAEWKGAEVRTQSSAQESLDALTEAIVRKDKIRADLGALQNRLENTMTNLEIQAENLQASESRISDVDVAKEMTEFTKNNVLVQAGVSMLAQANSMSQLALSLIG